MNDDFEDEILSCRIQLLHLLLAVTFDCVEESILGGSEHEFETLLADNTLALEDTEKFVQDGHVFEFTSLGDKRQPV